MSARSAAPALETPAEAAYKRDRALLRALYTCQPVLFDGKQHHLHSMYPQVLGGGISTIIYLMGDATPRQPSEITYMEQAE
ncbi:hypothetical protein LSO07_08635 [Janthinobacterium sp. PLB04]|uniref:Uncharacterized protein n=1 Tax=Janthinobacterium lividum TaxID=29581 RepID=A0AAJ4MVI4_9BURK|nr:MULTISPECIES: hypothetical protein [Janthinobacterium]KAB0331760.1 hypothetical protein F3B38_08715 [Janthinobacterium lividum]QSX97959.1 hypothetical protein J3P46_08625 [Janthinobacterium lividum]UGQ37930.1 hypothetical protein LSO07_08635 [Janthinobacterium sp. PLB04]